MGYHHCGLTQPFKGCYISVESIKRRHDKVFPASPPDLQTLLRLRRCEKIKLVDKVNETNFFAPSEGLPLYQKFD